MKRKLLKLMFVAGFSAFAHLSQAMEPKPVKPGGVIWAGWKDASESVIVGPGAMVLATEPAPAPESKAQPQNSTRANGSSSVSANNNIVGKDAKVVVAAARNGSATATNNRVGTGSTFVVSSTGNGSASANNNRVGNGATINVSSGLSQDQLMAFFKK